MPAVTPVPEVHRILAQVRRRWMAQRFVRELGRVLLAWAALALVFLAAVGWARHSSASDSHGLLSLAGWGALFGCAFAAMRAIPLRLPSLAEVAARLDRLGGTHDRLTTALAFSPSPATPMEQMAARECAAYLDTQNFRALLPWRFPREWAWLMVPLVAIALLQWDLRLLGEARAQLAAEAREKVSPTVEALQALARELEKRAEKTDDPELKKLAEEVAKRADALRQSGDPAEAEKERLRELSALEQLAQEMQTRREKALSPEELKALAQALAEAEATRKAAEEMKAGNNAAAADELERTAKNAEAEGGNSEAAKAEAALRQALDRLAQQNQLSPGAQNQLTPGQQSALQRLADALRQMPSGQGAKQNTQKSQGSQQSLNDLLTALQNMKFGDGTPGRESPDSKGSETSQTLRISPSTAKNDEGPSVDFPAASPNAGEKDTGTTETPFGERQESAKKGADLALSGNQTGRGETTSQALPGGLDVSRSSREYKALYDAMAAEAENAVLQEDIPLGSRLFIKRYFEAIRPTQ